MTKMMTRVAGVAVVLACLAQVGCVSSVGGNCNDGDSHQSLTGERRSTESVVVERSNGVTYERREMKIDPSVPKEYRQAMINAFLNSESSGVALSR
jgi:hypothetical protein